MFCAIRVTDLYSSCAAVPVGLCEFRGQAGRHLLFTSAATDLVELVRCLSQVHFEFPEPTELPPPLIQLNDVSFQYPGRDDFGLKDLNIGIVRLFSPAV